MKTHSKLRLLSLLGFLLLFAPFYDSCDGHRMKKAESNVEAVANTPVIIDSKKNISTEIDTISNSEETYESSFLDETYDFIDDDDSENALEFAKINFDEIVEFDYKEFIKGIRDEGFGVLFFYLKNLCFSFIILLTLLMLFFSILKKRNWIYKLAKINLILLIITFICIFCEGTFKHFNQIKWGYYAFIITNMLLFYYSRYSKIKT